MQPVSPGMATPTRHRPSTPEDRLEDQLGDDRLEEAEVVQEYNLR